MNAFHYAFKVKDIVSTRKFYAEILGCKEGRSTEEWIDFDFFGHQLSAHVSQDIPALDYCGTVDAIKVPIPHFGCILNSTDFDDLKVRLQKNRIQFVIKPYLRYKGEGGEQQTMFVLDFSGNPLEFKCFSAPEDVFKKASF